MLNLKKYIKEEIEKVGIKLDNTDVVRPPKEEMGDFAIPCFTINIDGVKNPHEKAKVISEKLNMNEYIISDIKVIGPYLNFTINRDFLAKETLEAISSEDNDYGSNKIGSGKDLLIEHTSINPNASPHIGRSRNSIIGDFLVRLYKFEGYNVEANYFINDIGKQISMLLVGVEKLGNIETITFSDMLKLYIEINYISKTDKEVEEKIFYYLHELENGNEEVRNKFKKITDICVEGQQEIFKKMDIKWDRFTHESDFVFENKTTEILEQLKEKGKLHEDENGRLYVDLSGYDIPTKSPVLVLTREDKTSLYPLRDVAYTISKLERNKDNNVIVLGEDQEVYMQQIAATLDILGFTAPKLVSYDFVLLNGDKMATREGKVVLLEEFIEKAKEKLTMAFKEKGTNLSDDEIIDLAASCIKYNMLNVNRKRTVNFNLESATDFQGNSAIYLLYNYARINSILEKANYCGFDEEVYKFKEDLEYSLIKSLYAFPEVVNNSYNTQESVIITNYLYDVAQKFSRYYKNISVLNEKDELVRKSRLALLNSTKTVLSNGMKILGINPVKKL
ncbi:MAG: arginine--tRNA ligase [Bacilli bacterium]|nr:arginine--tRNA ligase [Bacilli bacterium]